MRILFITATRIGDAVLSSGLLDHIILQNPEHRMTVVAGPLAAPLFEALPRLDCLYHMEKRRGGGHWLEFWRRTVGTPWDLVVDLRGSALSYALVTRRRVVGGRSSPLVHRVRELGDLFNLDPPPTPRIWLDPRHEASAEALLPAGEPVLALAPAANWPAKQWPAEHFAALANLLTKPGGRFEAARIAILAAAPERAMLGPLFEALPQARTVDLVGKLDLLTAAACLRRAAFFIGNDSGLMHLAAAAGTPTLGLFGPSREERYAPWGERCATVRTPESYDELVGQPGYYHLNRHSLMTGLTVDAVAEAAEVLRARLNAEPPRSPNGEHQLGQET